jgi:preprotein translocase subunit SecY
VEEAMENPLTNLFAVKDLRNRILFTLGLLAVYRVGNHIPTPGVNQAALIEMARQLQNSMFGLYDMFSGGNLSKVTIFALGVMPTSVRSIILQLLTVRLAVPRAAVEGRRARPPQDSRRPRAT